jgi:flavin-dependent dehydrogenase
MAHPLTLNNGSKIAIIGGGPAGSLFAHFINKYAENAGRKISVTIFDGKDFLQPGPGGCNLCAGVIANSLAERLAGEGIALPARRIISYVRGYTFHLHDQVLHLSCEENRQRPIATVFRGNGPRYSRFPENISFDDFLLTWAQDEGVDVISSQVWEIHLPDNPFAFPRITFGKKTNLQTLEADLIVGAWGVNSKLNEKIRNLEFGFLPPETVVAFQAEFKLGREAVQKNFGDLIHVYMPRSEILRYATVIPKDEYVTVTLLGKENATPEILDEFLRLKEIREIVAFDDKPACFCLPRIAVSPSRRPFAERLVIIGDASFSRHYKNGLESAFLTAQLAARTAVFSGIDSSSFSRQYYHEALRLIIRDNFYGRALFRMNDIISAVPLLTNAHFSLARKKDGSGAPEKIRRILWNMFTGNISYRNIFKQTMDFRLQASLLGEVLALAFRRLKFILERRTPSSHG